MPDTPLWHLDAIELARRIATGATTSAAVVDAHLARIAEVNPRVNAITRVLAEDARSAAAAADRAVAAGATLGPLHGVPITVKQNIDLVGSSTNWGLPALAEALPPIDSPVVERMKAAGAIPIARTNCPDMAMRVHTVSALFGLTLNPWDAARTCGGSSGGEAAALATGMSPLGLGNDIGGSLRNPATCCGIASIKPSAGLVPNATLIPAPDGPLSFQLMPSEGPMARRIADVRLALGVIAGPSRRDPYSLPVPIAGRHDAPLRVAVLSDPAGGSTDPRVAGRVRAAADALAAAGHHVQERVPPRFDEVMTTWMDFIGMDLHTLAPLIEPMMSEEANRFLGYVLASRPLLDLGGYTHMLMLRQALMRDWSAWFADVDVLLTPAWTQLPFAPSFDASSPEQAVATIENIRCVLPGNLLGLPSACVPTGLVDGVPVGVLCTAERFADGAALDAAAAIEAALALSTPIDPVGPVS